MFISRNQIILFCILLVIFVPLVFTGGFILGQKQIKCPTCQPSEINFSLFWEAYGKLKQDFISPEKIDTQKILYGAIEGMTKSLGDPYTAFFDPSQAEKFQQDLSGSFEGIGAEIGIKKEILTIISPLQGTPAENAGLKAGDMIAEIDGKDSSDMTTDEAVNLIRGPKGTIVTLTILRNGWTSVKEFKITRDTIVIHPVKWSLKESDTAYIKISLFDQTLPSEFKKITLEILKSPAKKIILDLRNNPGGYLEVAQQISGFFLEAGKTVTIEDFGKGKAQQIYKTEGNAELLNYPIVVLINQGSASASEILAGTLRDNRNIKLIGIKSFGKGSVQQVLDLTGGSFLKVTIAKWLTPKGVSISEVGLSPDIKADITDVQVEAGKDPQLDKALEIIKNLK